MILIRVSFNPIMLFTAKENGRGKKEKLVACRVYG